MSQGKGDARRPAYIKWQELHDRWEETFRVITPKKPPHTTCDYVAIIEPPKPPDESP